MKRLEGGRVMYDKSLESLRADYRDIWESQGWQDFRRIRAEDWDATLNRHQQEELNLLMHRFGVDASIMSPIVEQVLDEHIAVQMANTAKIDMVSLDNRKTNKDNVEDMRIAASVSYRNQDKGGRFSSKTYADMNRYGIAYWFKTWEMPREREYTKRDDAKMKPADWAKQVLKERDDYYDQTEHSIFGREIVSPLEMAHWPLEDPTVFVQVSVITYRDYRGQLMQAKDPAKRLYMTKDKKILWGDAQPPEEIAPNEWGGTFLRRIRRAKLDPETGIWHVTQWLTPGKTGPLSDETEELDDVECPFDHSPYFFAPGGHERIEETANPHLRYRPKIYPLIVKVNELNTYRSLLIKATIWLLEHPYGTITLNGVNAQMMQSFLTEHPEIQASVVAEGSGASGQMTWRIPDPGTDEIAIVPNAQPVQINIDALLASIQMVDAEIQRMTVNRYLLGQGDIDGNPARSVLDQHQAAKTPYGKDLSNADRMKEEWLTQEFVAMAKWPKSYKYRVQGDEPFAREPREAGEVVELTGDKIRSQPWMLSVQTANESDQERALAEDRADVAYLEKKAITREQWLKLRGEPDPIKAIEALEEDRREAMFKPWEDAVTQQAIQTLFLATTNMDLSMIGAQQGMLGMPPSQEQGRAQPPTVPANAAPAVEGPSGGTSPVQGMI